MDGQRCERGEVRLSGWAWRAGSAAERIDHRVAAPQATGASGSRRTSDARRAGAAAAEAVGPRTMVFVGCGTRERSGVNGETVPGGLQGWLDAKNNGVFQRRIADARQQLIDVAAARCERLAPAPEHVRRRHSVEGAARPVCEPRAEH